MFHSLRLSDDSKRCCGIFTYFGSASYLYQRMPMGLNISPSIWQLYINAILGCLQSRKHCEAIMDDLLLFTPSEKAHVTLLEDLLKTSLKNGLKISPESVSYLKQNCNTWEMLYLLAELQYMGHIIFIKDNVCVKPLGRRLKTIQNLHPLTTPKRCRGFVEMVNFLSMFHPELQKNY